MIKPQKKQKKMNKLTTPSWNFWLLFGNPGVKYDNTRHNIGFKALDYVAKQTDALFVSSKYGEITSFKYKGKSVFLLKPNTYMNLSGGAVNYWLKKEKYCLVIYL